MEANGVRAACNSAVGKRLSLGTREKHSNIRLENYGNKFLRMVKIAIGLDDQTSMDGGGGPWSGL
jgi:hypothetical protein